jgi:hypothetical protein
MPIDEGAFRSRASTFHEKDINANVEATKFYIRHREGYPETELQDYARRGFWTMGIETASFEWVDDIDELNDLGPTVGIAGYIGDIHRGLKRAGSPIPQNIDYPEPLRHLLHRSVVRGTLADVRRVTNSVFVKPELDHKLFTGFVWSNDELSRRKIVTCPDDISVWISEPITIISEYRTFILNNEVLDCRRYKGDWGKCPNHKIVDQAVKDMSHIAPAAYCIDFGITDKGQTILVEMNEGFSMGHYGLHPVQYARMLSARWFELASNKE